MAKGGAPPAPGKAKRGEHKGVSALLSDAKAAFAEQALAAIEGAKEALKQGAGADKGALDKMREANVAASKKASAAAKLVADAITEASFGGSGAGGGYSSDSEGGERAAADVSSAVTELANKVRQQATTAGAAAMRDIDAFVKKAAGGIRAQAQKQKQQQEPQQQKQQQQQR